MPAFLVTFDLHLPGCQYEGLRSRLREFPSSFHGMESSYLLVADGTADEVRDALAPHLHPGDGLLVTGLTNDVASWAGLRPEARRWMHTYLS